MDNVCHTLVGAALAESGLKRRTALGTATLLIAANLPDIDGLAYFGGPAFDLAWRRGWTHGVLALVVLPFLLTAVIIGADHLMHRMRRAALPSAIVPREVLLLSAIGILSHPLLDALNTYGVRLLMPFSDRWFYGDTLFIIDPWIWLALGAGVWLARRRRAVRDRQLDDRPPARTGLAVATAYIVAMAVSGIAARGIAAREAGGDAAGPIRAIMVSPMAVNPFARTVVVARDDRYTVAPFRWLAAPHLQTAEAETFARGHADSAAVAAAAGTVVGRRFLSWARFPAFAVDTTAVNERVVHIFDVRYALRPGTSFGSVSVPVRLPPR